MVGLGELLFKGGEKFAAPDVIGKLSGNTAWQPRPVEMEFEFWGAGARSLTRQKFGWLQGGEIVVEEGSTTPAGQGDSEMIRGERMSDNRPNGRTECSLEQGALQRGVLYSVQWRWCVFFNAAAGVLRPEPGQRECSLKKGYSGEV